MGVSKAWQSYKNHYFPLMNIIFLQIQSSKKQDLTNLIFSLPHPIPKFSLIIFSFVDSIQPIYYELTGCIIF